MDGSPHVPGAAIAVVAAPMAAAGSSDPSRRWAIAFPDGADRFAGVTRPEAERAIPTLEALGAQVWDGALVEVALAVLLSEGAGPYLLDVAGRITLVLGPHPAIADAHLAMGEPVPDHRVGLVRRLADGAVWEWLAERLVPPELRVAALDALDGLVDLVDAAAWCDPRRR